MNSTPTAVKAIFGSAIANVLLSLVVLVGSGGFVPGPRDVFIVRNTADDSPELARLMVNLRDGKSAEYLKEKQHNLRIVSYDAVDKDGKPSSEVSALRAVIGDKSRPVVVVSVKDGAVIHCEAIPMGMTDEQFISLLKRHGG